MPDIIYRKKNVISILLNLILTLFLMLSSPTAAWALNKDVLPEIRTLLQNQYADTVSSEVLTAPTIDEMLERLGDPYTMYFSPEQYQNFVGSIDICFSGLGIHIEMLSEGVKVVSVVQGSPAEEVGLKPGDVIIRADGQSLAGLPVDQAVSLLRGVEGSTVEISVQRGSETKDLNITRRTITEPTVTSSVLDGHIGYLGLKSFGSDTPKEFEKALKGKISHPGSGGLQQLVKPYDNPAYALKPIQCILYIENNLYTVSERMIKVNDLADMKDHPSYKR